MSEQPAAREAVLLRVGPEYYFADIPVGANRVSVPHDGRIPKDVRGRLFVRAELDRTLGFPIFTHAAELA